MIHVIITLLWTVPEIFPKFLRESQSMEQLVQTGL